MTTAKHVVLLGDSVFDNSTYVGREPAVIDQVREALGDQWRVSLLAVDGDVIASVPGQLENLPSSATHLIISVGGNDALGHLSSFTAQVASLGEALLTVASIQEAFGIDYERMLDVVLCQNLPSAICTIYDPNFGDCPEQKMAVAALATFNDRITRAAFARSLPLIDLRVLFSDKSHYANPIEPASLGGARIAAAIAAVVNEHPFAGGRSAVFCAP